MKRHLRINWENLEGREGSVQSLFDEVPMLMGGSGGGQNLSRRKEPFQCITKDGEGKRPGTASK